MPCPYGMHEGASGVAGGGPVGLLSPGSDCGCPFEPCSVKHTLFSVLSVAKLPLSQPNTSTMR